MEIKINKEINTPATKPIIAYMDFNLSTMSTVSLSSKKDAPTPKA